MMEGVGGELCLTLHCQGHLHNDLRIKIGSSMSRFKCFIFLSRSKVTVGLSQTGSVSPSS